jgi:hypothetical protein
MAIDKGQGGSRFCIGTFYQRISHVLFALFIVILVLVTVESVAHDMHAYEMHAWDARLRNARS